MNDHSSGRRAEPQVPLCRAFQMQTWQLRGAVHTVGCPLECDARMVTLSRAAKSSCLRLFASMALAPLSIALLVLEPKYPNEG